MSQAALRLAFAGMHPGRLAELRARHGGAEALLRALLSGRVEAPATVRDAVAVSAEHRLRELERLGVSAVARGDDGYPPHLARLPDAPPILFARGSVPSRPGVAVVGTRRCTAYGREVAFAYGEALAQAAVPVVSGLARGVDGAAHRGTVAGGGKGVGVLGSGIDVLYPPEHDELAEALVAGGGALVSEYPPGTPPEGWRFPPRNRIVAGMAAAVVVVEAPTRGGALITVGEALDQGIPVLAVPGDVDRETSRGCNLLIRDGAIPVLEPDDLLAELGLLGVA